MATVFQDQSTIGEPAGVPILSSDGTPTMPIHALGRLRADGRDNPRLSGRRIAALVGLAPQTCQSGTRSRRAKTSHRRPIVRRALFNAARAAIRHPSPLRDFYDRLVQTNNRPGKVALTAVMRKILVIANAVARDCLHPPHAQAA